MFALILLASAVFVNTIYFEPQVPLEQAYSGPGVYYWRVDFGPGDLVQSGVSLDEAPADWQPIYDEQWKRVAPWARRKGYTPPHDGCWDTHTCPPMLIKMAQVATDNPLEPVYYFFVNLLRSL